MLVRSMESGFTRWTIPLKFNVSPIFRSILEDDPAHRSAHLGLARCLRGVGEHPAAAAIYRTLIELDPTDPRHPVQAGVDLGMAHAGDLDQVGDLVGVGPTQIGLALPLIRTMAGEALIREDWPYLELEVHLRAD